jgi:hypothetical protein
MAGRLEFYWYETKPGEEAGTAWGQLAGASHRLHFVCQEIELCPSYAAVERALERLEYHMENYLVRVYELRERAVALVAALDGRVDVARQLKSARHRGGALQTLKDSGRVFTCEVERLLRELDADIALRNQHTHDKFLSVGIWTDNDIYDPADALLDLSTQPDAQEVLKEFLKEEMQRLVDEHVAKGKAVFDATWAFLEVVGPEMRTRRAFPNQAEGADAAVADLS